MNALPVLEIILCVRLDLIRVGYGDPQIEYVELFINNKTSIEGFKNNFRWLDSILKRPYFLHC
jgi:hypothetical protein